MRAINRMPKSLIVLIAAVITGIVGPIVVWYITTRLAPKPLEEVVPRQEKVFLREKTARELVNHLKSLPPLQRESVIRDSYINRRVRWKGRVFSVQATPSIQVGVIESDDSPGIFIGFSKEWLPKIEALREGDLIEFEGRISTIFNRAMVQLMQTHQLM